MSEEDNDEKLDLSAWEPQAPPSDFAERVLATLAGEPGKPAPTPAGKGAKK